MSKIRSGIYKITNSTNQKMYIGQSINIQKRINEHFWKANLPKDRSFNSILHQAIRKYGAENFYYEVLEFCSLENLDDRERYYIAKYNSITPNGYNVLIGGQKNKGRIFYCSSCNSQL